MNGCGAIRRQRDSLLAVGYFRRLTAVVRRAMAARIAPPRRSFLLAILAGIDEAGLGPLLGPLVVSGVAFRLPEDRIDRCMWDTLRESCTGAAGRQDRRLVIADSKRLYHGGQDLSTLERAVLVVLAAIGHRPRTWRELLATVAPQVGEELDDYPWYEGADATLPISYTAGDLPTQANAFRRDLVSNGIAFHTVGGELLPAGHFNRLVRNTRNKSVVSFTLTLRVMAHMLRSAGHERIRFCIDRQGGRTHYRDALMTGLSGFDLQIVEESNERSAYRLTRSSQVVEIEFITHGERRCFPIALASMFSKYLRELDMRVFNRFWSGQVTGLRPTAGYYTDAKRWLGDAAEELDRRGVDRRLLVRER